MALLVKNEQSQGSSLGERMTSIDFFRGLTMFLLIGESTELYGHLRSVNNGFIQFLATQLDHHEWNGLNFWDLIQPFFMFIVGVAIPFAVANRKKKGDSDQTILKHAFKRSLVLLLLGWLLYCRGSEHIVFKLQNVLAQLSVTYLVAFLIMRKSFTFQLIFTLAILLLTDLALCFSYWLIDVRKSFASGSKMFIVVGMNCIFIYLFFSFGGSNTVSEVFKPIINTFFSWTGELMTEILISLSVWATLWYACYWMFMKKIFIKI